MLSGVGKLHSEKQVSEQKANLRRFGSPSAKSHRTFGREQFKQLFEVGFL
jgi:hypothetical protein